MSVEGIVEGSVGCAAVVCSVGGIIMLIALFAGTPDLADALIYAITGGAMP